MLHSDVTNLIPAIQVKTVVDFMNNVQLYSVYLQNISFIKTILRFTLACSEAVPHHPPPLLTWDREGGGTVLKKMSAFGLKNSILVT